MKPTRNPFLRQAFLASTFTALVSAPVQAANTVIAWGNSGDTNWNTGTGANYVWNTATNWGNGSGSIPSGAGNIAQLLGNTSQSVAVSLSSPVTIGSISRAGSQTNFTLSGSDITMDGTGLTTIAGTNTVGAFVSGEANIMSNRNNSTFVNLTVNNNIIMMNTNLGIGGKGSSSASVTIGGNITNGDSATRQLNFRGSGSPATNTQVNGTIGATLGGGGGIDITNFITGSGALTLTGNIGGATGTGAAITISNNAGGTGKFNITGALGQTITSITQNSSTSTMEISENGGNTNYAGGFLVKLGTLSLKGPAGGTAVNFGSGTILLGDTAAGTSNAVLAITNSNTFSNNITVQSGNSGTKSLNALSSGGSPVLSGNLTLNDNLTVGDSGIGVNYTFSGVANTIANGKTLNLTQGSSTTTSTYTLSGKFSGQGAIATSGTTTQSAIIKFSSTNSDYSGGTTLGGNGASAVIEIAADTTAGVGSFGSGTIKLNGATLRADTGADRSLSNAISIDADTTFATQASEMSLTFTGAAQLTGNRILTVNTGSTVGGKSITFSNAIGQDIAGRTLTKAGAGVLNLNGANTYSGLTTVNAGALNIGSGGSLNSGNALTVGASGTANFANAGQTLGAVDNANTTTNALNFSASTGMVTLASLTGAGNTRFGSAGTVTGGISTGTVTSVGALTADISGGTITAGGLLTGAISNGTVGAGSLSSSSVTGGTTTVSGAATIGTMSSGTANLNGSTSSIATLNGGTVNLGTTALTVSNGSTTGSITGSNGSLTKNTSGMLTLSSSNSYGGLTTVSNGILEVTTDSALGTNAAGTSVTSGAAIKLSNVAYSTTEALSINGTGVSGGGALVNSGTSSYAGAVTAASNATINTGGGAITFTGGLVKNGTTLTLTGGGTVNVNTVGISGASANSDLVVDGTTVNLNTANSYNGPTYIRNGGKLVMSGSGQLPTSPNTALILDDSGGGSSTFQILSSSGNQTIASLTGASTSTIDLDNKHLTVGDSSSTIYAGNIIGGNTSELIKQGSGTLALSGTNSSFTGDTIIIGGKLTISATGTINSTNGVTIGTASTSATTEFNYNSTTAMSQSVSFASGSTGGKLSGSGTITPAVTVSSGNTLAPGNSIGTLSFGSGLTLAGTYSVELGTVNANPALSLSDRAAVTGALTVGGNLTLVDNANANSQGSASAGAYRIATYTTTLSGTFSSITNPLSSTLHEKVVYGPASGGGSVDLNLYRLATANTISTPVTLTNVRVGGTFGTSALSIQNTASTDGFSEGLNATQGSTSGSASVSGTNITNLAAGASSSSIAVGLGAADTSTAGAKTGTVAIGLASNGSGTSGYGTTALSGQTITVNGSVFNPAVANNIASPVTLTNVRVGGTFGTTALSISNTATVVAGYNEGLNATQGSTTGSASVSGTNISNLAAGSSLSTISVGLGAADTSIAGAKTGTVAIGFASNGTNSGLTDLTLAGQTITVNGAVFNPAVAGAIADVSVGKTRVGGTLSGTAALTISNTAPSGAFTEGLNATVGSSSGASGSGSITNLAGGSSDNSSISLGLVGADCTTSGLKTGTVTIDLASSGTNSGLSDLGLASQTVGVSGLVYDYADAVFSKSAGTGSFSGSGSSYSLNFGTGLALNTTYTATIQLANYLLSGYQDNLGGSYGSLPTSQFASGVENTSIASLVAGTANTFTITFNTGSTGNFSDTLTFTGASQQSGLSDATLGAFTINLTANAVPEPDVSTLIGGIGMLFLLRRRR